MQVVLRYIQFNIYKPTSAASKRKQAWCISVTWHKASADVVLTPASLPVCDYSSTWWQKIPHTHTHAPETDTQRGKVTGKHTLEHPTVSCIHNYGRNAGSERKMLFIREKVPGVSVVNTCLTYYVHTNALILSHRVEGTGLWCTHFLPTNSTSAFLNEHWICNNEFVLQHFCLRCNTRVLTESNHQSANV